MRKQAEDSTLITVCAASQGQRNGDMVVPSLLFVPPAKGGRMEINMEQKNIYPQGIKWTRQRKDVYEVLRHATEPLSAVQIYNHIEKNGTEGSYAVSTIYRILTVFEEKGLVTKTNWMGDGTLVYELNKGGHTHYAVCLNCHKRIPLHACPFEHMHIHSPKEGEDIALEEAGFEITGHKLELYGYCKTCKMQEI